MAVDAESDNFHWNHSFSEPDLTDHIKHLNRFSIKHPHEYIAVDDLKFFRRRQQPDFHTHSNVCLYHKDDLALPLYSFSTEYRTQFHYLPAEQRPQLLRKSTSLRLEGLMHSKSEYREQYHWYSPESCRSCRTFPIRYPENLHVGANSCTEMDLEYRQSQSSYPTNHNITPREMNIIETKPLKATTASTNQPVTVTEHRPEELAIINKRSEDKFKRNQAAQDQQKCHLQQRSFFDNSANILPSTEYQHQFVPLPLGKAHSIPQISHLKMKGDFMGVPEYSASFKSHDNYSRSAPIRKSDNLKLPLPAPKNGVEVPEYRQQFHNPPTDAVKEIKTLKTEDHLHPRGEFSKDPPEYNASFRDPQVKDHLPERGKGREPNLRLKGKLEFNPEYRSSFLDFPRSRPIVKKSTSSFRLPTPATSMKPLSDASSPKRTPRMRRKYKSNSPTHYGDLLEPTVEMTATPEYRRAHYNYQLRERTPPRKIGELAPTNAQTHCKSGTRAVSRNPKIQPPPSIAKNLNTAAHKRLASRHRPAASLVDKRETNFDSVTSSSSPKRVQPKFGRRAPALQNGVSNYRATPAIVADSPKYSPSMAAHKSQDSFVVLKEPCKRTNWMKKSWYE